MAWFRNFYLCADCDSVWTDEWSCMCDEDCPRCGGRHMSPYRSDDLTEIRDPLASPDLRIAATGVRRPVVAAVELATARATAEVAAQLAHELKAPLTFIHVRPRPPVIGGSVRSRRRSVRALFRAQSALDAALPVATRWGVMAQGEIVDGNPPPPIGSGEIVTINERIYQELSFGNLTAEEAAAQFIEELEAVIETG